MFQNFARPTVYDNYLPGNIYDRIFLYFQMYYEVAGPLIHIIILVLLILSFLFVFVTYLERFAISFKYSIIIYP